MHRIQTLSLCAIVSILSISRAGPITAGTAAALAAKHTDPDVHQVSIPELRERLRQGGAYLPEINPEP